MTRAEAIKYLKEMKDGCNDTFHKVRYVTKEETLDMAIKALEQEPCEDAISRQAVLDLIADYDLSMGQVVKGIHALPSVTPQEPKTGRWVHGEYCSECGCDVPAYISDWKWQKDMDAKYCPNCGCRMVEPQESEES